MVIKYIKQFMNNFQPYKGGVWCYEDGILMYALFVLYKKTKEEEYLNFVLKYYQEMINSDGQIKNYRQDEYNIDNIAPGIVLFDLYEEIKDQRYLLAIDELMKQLEKHPRTNEGSFWHKKRYPYQVWLDGIYMGQVFLRKYGLLYNKKEIFDDISNQLANLKKHLYDSKRQLYLHAYDELKVMNWADQTTGQSPNVWSRSIGWLAMALIEMLEIKYDENIDHLFKEMISGVDKYKNDNMWLQIVDRPDVAGNYKETSGTMMLCYAYLKGARLKLLDEEYLTKGQDIFSSTIKNCFYQTPEGYHLGGICEVAGLDNEKRDGSISYYLSEKIKTDEIKGVAPFILAYTELI